VTAEPEPHVIPEHQVATCSCGFYAYFDEANDYADSTTVTGVIEAYGKVTIGTRGFRAEKARLRALVIPRLRNSDPNRHKGSRLTRTQTQRVRANYPAVPIFDTQSAMTAEFTTTEAQVTPTNDPEFWTRSAS
jgi:hypothetical protein